MGWWGYDIMEGDTPLDCEGDLKDYLVGPERLAELEAMDDGGMEIYEQIQAEAYDALKFPVNSTATMLSIQDKELCDYAPNIAMQVLGEMIMVSGHPFPQTVRSAAIAAAEAEIQYDSKGWKTEGARERCLQAYIGRVNAYVDGVASEPSSKGLFATIAEGMPETP
jgi:hypothetical protein